MIEALAVLISAATRYPHFISGIIPSVLYKSNLKSAAVSRSSRCQAIKKPVLLAMNLKAGRMEEGRSEW